MELDPDRRQPRTGITPVSSSPIIIGGVLSELFYDKEEMFALVRPEVSDDSMACGGRQRLHERLLNRSKNPESIAQFCGKCPVKDMCTIGQARL